MPWPPMRLWLLGGQREPVYGLIIQDDAVARRIERLRAAAQQAHTVWLADGDDEGKRTEYGCRLLRLARASGDQEMGQYARSIGGHW